ncbi:MAG: hypothetical protein S4CHLAM102_03970 [Chlamydiia bacterium]|nr:hypothetical protein [Chlamydiia bacterium]
MALSTLATFGGLASFGCAVIGSMCGRKALELHRQHTDIQESAKEPLSFLTGRRIYAIFTCKEGFDYPSYVPGKPLLSRTIHFCPRHLGLRSEPEKASSIVAAILYGRVTPPVVKVDHSSLIYWSREVQFEGLEKATWDNPCVKETIVPQADCRDDTPLTPPDNAKDKVIDEIQHTRYESYRKGPLTFVGMISTNDHEVWQISPPEGNKHYAVTDKSPTEYAEFKKEERNSQTLRAIKWIAGGLALAALSARLACKSEKDPPQGEELLKTTYRPHTALQFH